MLSRWQRFEKELLKVSLNGKELEVIA